MDRGIVVNSPSGIASLLWGGTKMFVGDFSSYSIDAAVDLYGTCLTNLDLIVDVIVSSYAVGFAGQSNVMVVISGA